MHKLAAPWACHRNGCGETMPLGAKGTHIERHRRESICEVGTQCGHQGDANELLRDGRMACYRCFGENASVSPSRGQFRMRTGRRSG